MPTIYFIRTDLGNIVDRYTLSVWANRSMETIRRRCTVHEYHPDGRALYIADAAMTELAELRHTRNRLGQLRSERDCA